MEQAKGDKIIELHGEVSSVGPIGGEGAIMDGWGRTG